MPSYNQISRATFAWGDRKQKGSTACGGGSNEGVHALEGCMSYYVLRRSRIGARKNMKAQGSMVVLSQVDEALMFPRGGETWEQWQATPVYA